ncbi:MAG: DNA polymerase III subunit delta' [Pseudomonadota bacterium]|nr:DNA polymerase III subunit delta' [Gammaproteobacteria bacterium]
MSDALLPWHQPLWERLQQRRQASNLPHALLLAGDAGLGKQIFAKQFAHVLLCSQPLVGGTPCQQCHACHLMAAETHPDFHLVQPEAEGKAIKIDQVRALIEYSYKTPQISAWKVIVIAPADAMNINAANALLKTLEEPVSNTQLLLVTARPMALLATIRSRCQALQFKTPDSSTAFQWLRNQQEDVSEEQVRILFHLAQKAPLRALNFIRSEEWEFRAQLFSEWLQYTRHQLDLVSISKVWSTHDLHRVIFHLQSWVQDLTKWIQTGSFDALVNTDLAAMLKDIAARVDEQSCYRFLDQLNQANAWVHSKIALNAQLLIEQLLVQWSDSISVMPS